MGIQNLLPFVKKACRQGDISELRGLTVAIDVSCLLHKGLFGCVEQFANGEDSKFYIHYVMKHIRALLNINCHVIVVFDGQPLPAKKDTNDQRSQKRKQNMMAGNILLSQGKKDEAVNKFQQAVSITKEVVESTIEVLRKLEGVDVIVSPYESDAQMSYLTSSSLADAVITEDSDLIAFGCDKIIFKWSADTGSCTIYDKQKLPQCFSGPFAANFDFTKFRRICILSGCDYLQSGLAGIGLSKALQFWSKTDEKDLRKSLPRIPGYLKMPKLKVSKQFIEDFIQAENTFLYQIVFDPVQRCQKPLTPYPLKPTENKENSEDDVVLDEDFIIPSPKLSSAGSGPKTTYEYAGSVSSASTAVRHSLGNTTKESPLSDKFILPKDVPEWSVWSSKYLENKKDKKKQEKLKKRSFGVIVVEDVESQISKGLTSSDAAPIRKVPRKIKNEALMNESVDQLMLMYGDIEVAQTVEVETSVSSQTSTCSSNDSKPSSQSSVDEKEEIIIEASKTAVREEISDSLNSSQEDITVAKVEKQISTPTTTSVSRSIYFKRRTSTCSNPFKRPKIEIPTDSPKVEVEESPKRSGGILSAIDCEEDEKEDNKPVTRSPNLFAVGYRASGLRCSRPK